MPHPDPRWRRRCLPGVMAALLVAQSSWAGPLRIGSIGHDAVKEVETFLPLARYLERQLQAEGIDRGSVVVARSIPEMATLLRQARVDLYIDSPFPSAAVSHLSGSKFLLRRWKRGVAEYHAVLFVKRESGISRVEELQGKTVGFEEPYSTTGYFLPTLALKQKGFDLVQRNDPAESVPPGQLAYVFTDADVNTMAWVLRGKISAGAMDDQNYLRYGKGHLDQLQIILRTFSVPRQLVAYRSDLPPALVSRVKDILMRMHESEEGRAALHEFQGTTRFDELPAAATAAVQKLQRFIDGGFRIQ